MLPAGSVTGNPAPIAAAIGSSIRYTSRAPADSAVPFALLDAGKARKQPLSLRREIRLLVR
jgi:hypothetical protein